VSLVLALPLAFAAGVLTILSPCVLPLIPIVVAAGRATDPRGPLALAMGLALTFGVVGGALAAFGVEFGALAGVREVSAAVMITMGLVLMVRPLANALEARLARLARLGGASQALSDRLPKGGLLGQAAAGGVLALAWAPCAGPTLGAAFALAADGHSIPGAMLTMFAYALGTAGALLAVGFGLGRLAAGGRSAAAAAGARGRFALGATLAVFGALVVTGLDHRVETALVAAMPDWLVNAATSL
jgi:cytochrome c biogenesis protein CcdA